MRALNLGILAHVDAGKTSLTERLLYAAGVIDSLGRVDDGNTQTDTMSLERQRGITIRSAVVSFTVDDVAINLIDTPGHPDFIAEVERVLDVLDGAILVISAVEGVQAQTRVLMRALRRLGIPTIIFVNKVDRLGAIDASLLDDISAKLGVTPVPMGRVDGIGTRTAAVVPYDGTLPPQAIEALADHDDELLAAYVDGRPMPYAKIRAVLARLSRCGRVHPVFFGSAVTGTGVPELVAGLTEMLPTAAGDADAPTSGAVFKIDRGDADDRVAYVRMFAGTLRLRDRLAGSDKITGLRVAADGGWIPGDRVQAGQIARLSGLSSVRIGDAVGIRQATRPSRAFAPPTLETIVRPARAADRGVLHTALAQLAEQDPLINLRHDDVRQETYVSLYGEVQKEVIGATLANDYGLMVGFEETTTICIERPYGSGAAAEVLAKAPNPFLATVGLRVDPAPIGSGVEFRLEVELGSMPSAFMTAVEETVHATLGQGRYGWQVTDCVVTLTHSGYWARQSRAHGGFDPSMSSKASDFRSLTPLVLMDALISAGTHVYEPIQRFTLELPADRYGPVLPVLARLGAVPDPPVLRGSICVVTGDLPSARVHELQQLLPTLSRGEGMLDTEFDRYERVHGPVPRRSRSDLNPLNRKEYLLNLTRRR